MRMIRALALWTRRSLLAAGLLFGFAMIASAAPPYHIVIQGSQFHPAELQLPAGRKVTVVVKNKDTAPAEFESYDLNIEKVIPGHTRTTLYVGPLSAGKYRFFNDFHQAAKGRFVVK